MECNNTRNNDDNEEEDQREDGNDYDEQNVAQYDNDQEGNDEDEWYNDGEDKMRRRVWILDHAVLIAFGDKLFIADKETFKMSHVDLPEAYYDKITYHFVPGKGLMIQILIENVEYETDSEDEKEVEEESYVPTYSVWVGHISMKFLPKGEWRGNWGSQLLQVLLALSIHEILSTYLVCKRMDLHTRMVVFRSLIGYSK